MKQEWLTSGFAGFSAGSFGNAGQNCYVSRAGVLQRIFQYDLNHNGYFDLAFPQTQNHHEAMPSYVYREDGSRLELPGQGGSSGLVADLTGDGFVDLVIANHYDAAQPFASADIYFGSAEGFSEKRHLRLPAPWAKGVAAGRFAGEKTPSLAFTLPCYGVVRIFSPTELGCFEWMRYTDLAIAGESVAAVDLDGDGFDELIVRKNRESAMRVYWGGPDGLNPARCTELAELPESECDFSVPADEAGVAPGFKLEDWRLVQTVEVGGRRCFTRITGRRVEFFAATGRTLEKVLELDVPRAVSVVQGDLDGDGCPELIISARAEARDGGQNSFIYWGNAQGSYSDSRRTPVPTLQAVDAALLSGNRVIFAQGAAGKSYTMPAPIFSCGGDRTLRRCGELTGEFAKRVFAVENPGCGEEVVIVNTYDRSAVGAEFSVIYWGGPDGFDPERRTLVPCRNAVDTFSADLDDDGWAELVICNNTEEALHLDEGQFIHHFGPEGFEPARSRKLPVKIGWAATVADFDRDGCLEIASVGDHYENIKFFRCLPDGDFEELYTVELGRGGHARWLVAVDLNRNGWLDLVVPCNRTERSIILWGGPEGFSMERHTDLAVYQGACARCADLTKNGYPDLIIGTHTDLPTNGELPPHQPQHSFLHIYWNGPEGLSEARKTVLRSDASDSIAVGDFNGDGWLDVFAGSYHAGKDRDCMSYLYWNRQGNFRECDRELLYTHSVAGCLAGDFNNDGFVDLAVANHKFWGNHHYESAVWWNGPEGFDSRRVTLLPTDGPHGLSAVEPGNQLDRGEEEYYFSVPYELGGGRIVSWKIDGELPPDTWVRISFAFADTREGLETAAWGEWFTPGAASGTGKFARYRLALGARLGLRSPRLTAVRIAVDSGGGSLMPGWASVIPGGGGKSS